MTLQVRRGLILAAAFVVAALLAFPLREAVYQNIVIPVAFILWNLSLFYRSYPQGIWWGLLILIVLFMIAFSLVPQPRRRGGTGERPKPSLGQVESLALWLHRAERGVYFKWLVANRLGKLAYQILVHRESGRPRSVFAPLLAKDWEPAKELQNYLEVGLHGSFADFPYVKRSFGTPQRTPLDFDVAEAVKFLESQVENGNHRSTRMNTDGKI